MTTDVMAQGAVSTAPEDGLENAARILGEFAARCPARCVERIAHKPRRCALCREEIAVGSVVWTSTRSFQGGRKWWTDVVCRECPEPMEPARRVTPEQVAKFWRRRAFQFERTGRRGRPAVRLGFDDLCILADLRAAGFGETRTAREFHARTGRRISARTLARFGRD
jgi:hypothetical protein